MAALALLMLVPVLALGCQDSDVSRELGARCETSRDCDDRCLPSGAGYPGGFCTAACNASAECPTSSACADRDGGVCLFQCKTDVQCGFLGAGWTCKDSDERGASASQVMVCRGD
jgi:hypothetical protein